jgi:hypothetical protein
MIFLFAIDMDCSYPSIRVNYYTNHDTNHQQSLKVITRDGHHTTMSPQVIDLVATQLHLSSASDATLRDFSYGDSTTASATAEVKDNLWRSTLGDMYPCDVQQQIHVESDAAMHERTAFFNAQFDNVH